MIAKPIQTMIVPAPGRLLVHNVPLQRTCACGGSAGLTGRCSDCRTKRLLGRPLQTKLRVNEPGDEYEQEADRVAEQVTRMPEANLDKKRDTSMSGPVVQRRAREDGSGLAEAPPIVHEVLNSPGQRLDPATQTYFERRFGHDFGNVRIHADAKAAESARAVNASAYTVGLDVSFAAGQYRVNTSEGRRLLAHELTHVIQQRSEAAWPRSSSLQRTASFVNGSVHHTLNLADRILNGVSAGETDFVLNGSTFTNVTDGLKALHVPRVKSSKRGRRVGCSFASVADNEVSFTMRLLSPDPWSSATTKATMGNVFPGLSGACIGGNAATFVVHGMPTNQDQRDRTRVHEDHHADDYRIILKDIIGPWDKAVTEARSKRTAEVAADKDQCTAKLYDKAVGPNQRPDDLVKAIIAAINEKARRFHASAAGRNVRVSNPNADRNCDRVTAEAR
jgi:hypothetical protein